MYNNLNNGLYKNDYNNLKENTVNNNGNLNQLSKSHITTETIKINIDSRNRNIKSKNYIERFLNLTKNPLKFIYSPNYNNLVEIYCQDHNLNPTDKITINNVSNKIIKISNNKNLNTKLENIIFHDKKNYIEFIYDIKSNNKFKFNNNPKIDLFEPQYIFITDVICNDKYIYNMPVNLLMGKHKIYFDIDDKDYNLSSFFIKIPLILEKNDDNNIDIIISFYFQNLAGVNLNSINSDFNNDYKEGFKNIHNIINKDVFSIKLNSNIVYSINNCSCVNNCDGQICGKNGGCGGHNIKIGKIKKTIKGYPNPNNYSIDIGLINNIKDISILASDFPHTEYNIKSTPKNLANNKLYFNILFNPEKEYKIELEPGYYNLKNLIDSLKLKISKLKHEYINKDYLSSSNLIAEIVDNNDLIKFKLNKIINLKNSLYIYNQNHIKVNHISHNLKKGDEINISNALGTNKISAYYINGNHIIDEILDNNNYIIKLDEVIEYDDDIKTSNGGADIIIKFPIIFRLDFSKSDTIGELLGFRNVGNIHSKTHYLNEITNRTPYYNEALYNNNDELIEMKNNRINLFDKNYIFLSVNFFNYSDNESSVLRNNYTKYTNIAKIYLNNLGSVVYNNHINLNRLDYIIPSLNKIEFLFHDNNNNIYDFGNRDHSFILSFVIEKIMDKNTLINTNTGLSSVNSSIQKVTVDVDNTVIVKQDESENNNDLDNIYS